DESHDILALTGRQGLIASPCDRPHQLDDFFLTRAQLEDVAPRQDRLERIVPPRDDIRTKYESAVEDKRAGQVVKLRGAIGDDARVTPQCAPQEPQMSHRPKDRIHIVEEDDPIGAVEIEARVESQG